MKGQRMPNDTPGPEIPVGGYARQPWLEGERAPASAAGRGGVWYVRDPIGGLGMIGREAHHITEHEDGSITVTPSIHNTAAGGWHGFLTAGVWRSC